MREREEERRKRGRPVKDELKENSRNRKRDLGGDNDDDEEENNKK